MPIVATKEESPTRTVLEIEVPAERVEEAIADTTRAYARKAAIPGFRKGKAPESVIRQKFGDQIRADALEALLPDAVTEAIQEKQLAVLGRPRVDDLKWEPPGPIRFSASLDLKPTIDASDWRGVTVEDQPVDPVGGRGLEGHRPHPRGARGVPPRRRPRRGAGRLRRRRHRGLVRRDPRAGPEPADVPRREADPRGRPRGLDARDQRGAAGGPPGGDAELPQDLPGRLPERRVPREDRRLPGDARRAEGEEAAIGRRRVRPGGRRRRDGRDAPRPRARRGCARRRTPTGAASSAAPSSTSSSRDSRSRRRTSSSSRRRRRPCATTRDTSRRAASIRRRRTGRSSRRRRGPAPSGASASTSCSTRSPRRKA